jgi:drug/metabolite transporter (DMT)-like permease
MTSLTRGAFISHSSLLILSAAALWALDGILRRSLYHLPAITIISIEHWIGALLITIFCWNSLKKIQLNRTSLVLIAGVALFSGILGTLFFTQALLATQFIPFSVVFLLQKLQPLFAILFGWIVLRETLPKHFIPWAALALIAAFFVTFPLGAVNLNTGDGTMAAALFALGAALLWGSSTAFSRRLTLMHGAVNATALRFIATALFAPFFILGMGHASSLATVTGMDIVILLTIALSTGMVALFLYYKGLEKTPVRVATILELAFPLIAVIIDVVLYDSVLHFTQYIAAIVLLYAMIQVSNTAHDDYL